MVFRPAPYKSPQPYRSPEQVVHDWIADYQLAHPGDLPKIAWLMRVTGLAMGTVAKYRKTFARSGASTGFNALS